MWMSVFCTNLKCSHISLCMMVQWTFEAWRKCKPPYVVPYSSILEIRASYFCKLTQSCNALKVQFLHITHRHIKIDPVIFTTTAVLFFYSTHEDNVCQHWESRNSLHTWPSLRRTLKMVPDDSYFFTWSLLNNGIAESGSNLCKRPIISKRFQEYSK